MRDRLLKGRQISPEGVGPGTDIVRLVDETFLAFNAARLREACRLLATKMIEPDVTVGLSITGALTPAGLGMSCVIPLIENGFVDWIVTTGANLYHDSHFALGMQMHAGSPFLNDLELRNDGVVRIYDILFDYDVLLSTDAFYRETIRSEEFQREMSTAEFHFLIGRYLAERERILGLENRSILSSAFRNGVPVYTSSPGDSSIGLNLAAEALKGNGLRIDISRDINETAAIVLHAKRKGRSAAWILGGGSPKNFLLQTVPHLQEILGIDHIGHDYFLQITDSRPDTGGLSGATPAESITWWKLDPDMLPDAVVCYTDSTIALPIMTAYALESHKPRKPARLYGRLNELYTCLLDEASRPASQRKS